jgi:uncharacterized protein YaaR (DUF327 family)
LEPFFHSLQFEDDNKQSNNLKKNNEVDEGRETDFISSLEEQQQQQQDDLMKFRRKNLFRDILVSGAKFQLNHHSVTHVRTRTEQKKYFCSFFRFPLTPSSLFLF